MSYDIEYNRLFLKSGEGITPCVLMGSNNVTELHRGHERRARSWSVFLNMPGNTEKDMLDAVSSWLGGYGEHWKRNGKWVDDKGLINWIKSGCRNAMTLEDFLTVNPGVGSVSCYVSVWTNLENKICDMRTVRTSDEFDEWIRLVKSRISTKAANEHLYPVVDLALETFNKGGTKPDPSGKVIAKYKKRYLSANCTTKPNCWTTDITQAKIFDSAAECREFLKDFPCAKIVSGRNLEKNPYDTVIETGTDASDIVSYISRVNSHSINMTMSLEYAKKYPNLKAAGKTIDKIKSRYPRRYFNAKQI